MNNNYNKNKELGECKCKRESLLNDHRYVDNKICGNNLAGNYEYQSEYKRLAETRNITNNEISAAEGSAIPTTAKINQPSKQVAKMSVKNTDANNSIEPSNCDVFPQENTDLQNHQDNSMPEWITEAPPLDYENQGINGVDNAILSPADCGIDTGVDTGADQVRKIETIESEKLGVKCLTHKVKTSRSSIGISNRFIRSIRISRPNIRIKRKVIHKEWVGDELTRFNTKFCAVISGMGSGKTTGQVDAIKLFDPKQPIAKTVAVSPRILLCESIANSLTKKTGKPFTLYSNLGNITHVEEREKACQWLVITPNSLPTRIKEIKANKKTIVFIDEIESFVSLINTSERSAEEILKALRILTRDCGRIVFMDANMGKSAALLMKMIIPDGYQELELLVNTYKRFQDTNVHVICPQNDQTEFVDGKLVFTKSPKIKGAKGIVLPLDIYRTSKGKAKNSCVYQSDRQVSTRIINKEIKRQKTGITRAKNDISSINIKKILGKMSKFPCLYKTDRQKKTDGLEQRIDEIKAANKATLPLSIRKIVKVNTNYSPIYQADNSNKIRVFNQKIEQITVDNENQNKEEIENKYSFEKSKLIAYALIIKDLMAGKNIYFASSSKESVRDFMRYIKRELPEKVSTAITRDMNKQELEICSEILNDDTKITKLHVLAISPKLSMGASFDEEHFHKCYLVLPNGTSTPDHKDAIQLAGRVRNLIDKKIIIACDFKNVSICPRTYAEDKAIENNVKMNADTPLTPSQKLAAMAYDMENAIYRDSKAHYFEYLIRDMEDTYGEIEYCFYDAGEKFNNIRQILVEIRAEAKAAEQELIIEALPLMRFGKDLMQFEMDSKKKPASPLDREIIKLSRKFERIGWDSPPKAPEILSCLAVLKDYGNVFRHLDLLASTSELNIIAKAYAVGVGSKKIFKKGIRNSSHLIKKHIHLCELALDAGTDSGLRYQSKESKKLRTYIRDNKSIVKTLIGNVKVITSDAANRSLIRRIIKPFGYKIERLRFQINGKREYRYGATVCPHIELSASKAFIQGNTKAVIIKEIEKEDKKVEKLRAKTLKTMNPEVDSIISATIKHHLNVVLNEAGAATKRYIIKKSNANYKTEIKNGKTEQEAGDITIIKAQRLMDRMGW